MIASASIFPDRWDWEDHENELLWNWVDHKERIVFTTTLLETLTIIFKRKLTFIDCEDGELFIFDGDEVLYWVFQQHSDTVGLYERVS